MTYPRAMRAACTIAIVGVISACGASEAPKPKATSAPTPTPTTVATSAPTPTSDVAKKPAPPPSPFEEPMICSQEQKRCYVATFDADTQARLETLADRADYEITLVSPDDAAFATLARAPWIRKLNLSKSKLTSLAPLAALKDLSSLVIDDDDTIEDLSPLAAFSSLRVLELDGLSKPKDWSPVSKLSSLSKLSILRASIAKLPDVAAWTSLDELHLEGNDALKDFSLVAKLPTLKIVHVGYSPIASLAPFAKLPALQDLAFEETKVVSLAPLRTSKTLAHVVIPPEVPLSERAALQKALPKIEIEVWSTPKNGITMLSPGHCVRFEPGCCICDGDVPCPKTMK